MPKAHITDVSAALKAEEARAQQPAATPAQKQQKPLTPGRALDLVDRIMANLGAELTAAADRVRARNLAKVEAILDRVDDESARALIRDRYGLRDPEAEPVFADEDVEVDP